MTSIGGSPLLPSASLEFFRHLVNDLRIDLERKITSFNLFDRYSKVLVESGATLSDRQTTYGMWLKARFGLVQGNCIASVRLCQSVAEHVLAAHAFPGLSFGALPTRAAFEEALHRCLEDGVIVRQDTQDLRRLMAMPNRLPPIRETEDVSAAEQERLFGDARFAVELVGRLLALPRFN
jgi:hypothetical protein